MAERELTKEQINDLIESGDLSTESEEYEVMEALDLYANPDAIMELFDSVGCEDYECLEEKSDYDSLLCPLYLLMRRCIL